MDNMYDVQLLKGENTERHPDDVDIDECVEQALNPTENKPWLDKCINDLAI